MQLHLGKYLDCVCEVRSLHNELLGVGVVDEGAPDELVLKGATGHHLPLIHYNTQVKISILSKASDFIILVGTVFTSTAQKMKMTGVTTLQQYERRNFFRVSVNVEAVLYPETESGAQENDGERPIACIMRDISLGGCLLESDSELKLGQRFVMEFVLEQVKHKLKMTICRHAEAMDQPLPYLRFGGSFGANGDAQIDAVCKDLFVLQRKIIQRRRGQE